MARKLDLDENGAQYLPFANDLLLKLKQQLNAFGQNFGRVYRATPDGLGTVFCRTLRADALRSNNLYVNDDPNGWWDYIRIRAESLRGFVVSPTLRFIRDPLNDIPASHDVIIADATKLWVIPFAGGKWRQLKGYTLQEVSPYPMINGKHTNTGAYGTLFRDGAKLKAAQIRPSIGSFVHTYTVDGVVKHVVLTFNTTFHLTAPVIGVLPETGVDRFHPDLVSPYNTFTYTVSPDGRTVVVTFVAFAQVFILDIDLARTDAYVICSNAVSSSSFPSITSPPSTITRPYVTTTAGDAQNTVQSAVTPSGLANITVDVKAPSAGVCTFNGTIGPTVPTSLTFVAATQVVLTLPDGTQVIEPLDDVNYNAAFVPSGDPGDATLTLNAGKRGTCRLLYMDASIPCILYALITWDYTIKDTDGTLHNVIQGHLGGTVTYKLRLIIGGQKLTVTDVTIPITDTLNSGFTVPTAVTDPPTLSSPLLFGPGASLTNQTFYTLGTPWSRTPDNYFTNGSTSTFTYFGSVAFRNAQDWIIALKDTTLLTSFGPLPFGGQAVATPSPGFHILAGRLDPAALRAQLLENLLTRLRAAGDDPLVLQAIADLEAGNLAPYDIRLNGVPPISATVLDPWYANAFTSPVL